MVKRPIVPISTLKNRYQKEIEYVPMSLLLSGARIYREQHSSTNNTDIMIDTSNVFLSTICVIDIRRWV